MRSNITREDRPGVWTLVSRPGSETIEEYNERVQKIMDEEEAERKILREINRKNSFVNKPKGWRM